MLKNSLAAVVLVAILSLVIAGCSNLSGVVITLGDETGALFGTVTDAATKDAIEDVQVTVSDKSDVTDARGKYRIENLSVGSRTITAKKSGYEEYFDVVDVNEGENIHDIVLTPIATVSPAPEPSPSSSLSPIPSISSTITPTPTVNPTATSSPTVTPISSPSPTVTASPTLSPTPSPTQTPTPASTPSPSPSPTSSPSPSPTPTPSSSPPPSPTPTPTPNSASTANAGPDQTVGEGVVVTLNGSGSSDPDGDSLSYSWSQTAGTTVTLSSATTANPTFTSPLVSTQAILTFQLTVNDGRGGTSSDTVNVTVNDTTPPANVTSFTATAGNGQVSLSWVNSTGSDFSGVKILRKVGSYPTGPTDGTAIYDSLGTSYTDTGLTNGTTYYYKAYAHDEVPNYASGAQVSAMPDGTPPGNITAFTVTQGTNNGEITGSWTNPSDSDFVGVRFRYRTDGTFPTSATDGTLLGDKTDSPGTAGSITWTGLNPETTYQIKGFAYDAVLNYASGTSASSGIKPKDLTPPSNVASFTATAGDSQVSLSWTNPSVVDFAGVKVVRKTGGYPTSPTDGVVIYDSTGTGFTDTGLNNGTTYYYKAYAYDEVPNYASGVQASAVPADVAPPGNITAFTVTQGTNNGEIMGSWTNPSDSDFVGVRFRYRTDGVFPTSVTNGILLGDKTGSPGATDSITWTGLNPETTYYIRGFAYDEVPNYALGTSASSGIKPRDLTPPANVASFVAAAGDSQATLSWTNPTDSDFAGVKILRKTGGYPTSPADGTVVYNGTGTGYTDTGLTNGTIYYYAAFTYDEVPNYSSGAQASATLTVIVWATRASMPTARRHLAVGVVGGKIYAIGGWNGGGLATVEEYDPTTNTWTNCGTPAPGNGCAPMPTGRYALAVGVVNDKIYAIGGHSGSILPTVVEEYDPATNAWTNCGTPAPGNGCASIPTAREWLTVGVVGGKIYAIGGTSGGSFLTTVEEYNPATNTWTTKTPMLTGRSGLAVGVVNNKIYAIGGSDGSNYLTTVEEYDPTTDTWAMKTAMPTSRAYLAVGVVNNRIYAIGGWNGSSYFTTVEEYGSATNQWLTKAPMSTGRSSLAVGVMNNKIYAIGGVGSPGETLLNVVEEATISP